ncbi:MAG: holo-ACP synthase [Bacilli bacterium]|nr:holo-ACP synthase [Bacilli bacterium]
MIKGIGVDIALIKRFFSKDGKFVQKILSEIEFSQYTKLSDLRKVEYLAGRFCAKEAYYKAKKNRDLGYHDIEILDDKKLGVIISDPKAHLSISHDGEYVIAFVIIEE